MSVILANADLRRRADEARPGRTRSVLDTTEDPGNAVGFGEQRRVADGERCAQAEAAQGADGRRRLGQEKEGHGVRHEDAQEEDVAQLAARRLHQWRVIVADQHPQHQARAQEARGVDLA